MPVERVTLALTPILKLSSIVTLTPNPNPNPNPTGGNYSVWELVLFVLVGCLGGLIGAFFNACNEYLTKKRMAHVTSARAKGILA